MRTRHATSALALLIAFAATAPAAELGRTHFPTSGSPAAQEHFLEGLLYLHSFEYDDARDSFVRARELEPDFAMAAWGEAMTHNHALWMRVDPDAARAALERLAPTREERLALAPTARERGYLEAVEVLYGEGTKRERDLAYAEAMRRLQEAHPDDLDAASFYALALLGTCHEGRDVATYMRAAAVVEEVFDRNPRHPGAAHYLIHSYDDPVHAPLGLRPARVYAEIAPAAEHALHMPSHIFLALGMWEETAASNVDAYAAGEARRERRGQGVAWRGYHSLLWLHYAYLQLGRFDDAYRQLEIVARDVAETGATTSRAHLALMRAAWIVETGDPARLPPAVDPEELSAAQIASDLFATGYAAHLAGDLAAARKALGNLEQHVASLADGEATDDGYASGPTRTVPPEILKLELEALLLHRDGKSERALELLARAAAAEEALPFGFGPPVPGKPAAELYGELLLDLGRPDAARRQFENALARAPRRALALKGLQAAAHRAGDAATASAAAEELAAIRSEAAKPAARGEVRE